MEQLDLKKEALRLKEVSDKAIELKLSSMLEADSEEQIEKQLNVFSFEIKEDIENNAFYVSVSYNCEFLRACIIYEGEIVETLNEKELNEIISQF